MARHQQKKPGALSMSPEALERLRGEIDASREAGMDIGDWRIKQRLEKQGKAWNRENYIHAKWLGELPEEWDESEIPEDLQDWERAVRNLPPAPGGTEMANATKKIVYSVEVDQGGGCRSCATRISSTRRPLPKMPAPVAPRSASPRRRCATGRSTRNSFVGRRPRWGRM